MAKGVTSDPSLREEARRLRSEEGLYYHEIAERLGAKRSTVAQWCLDPEGSAKRARVDSYRGTCMACGGFTNGSDGPDGAPDLCQRCLNELRTRASREWIIDSIQRWADLHGGIPPVATDWNVSQARAYGRSTAEYETGQWPAMTTVQRAFGSWSAGIKAAGFEPFRVGCYGREGEGIAA